MKHKTGTALVFGSFDMLHRGHRYFLERSREQGRRLLVVLARDDEIYQLKQRWPVWNFAQRKAALLESGLVDEVLDSDAEHGTFYVLQGTRGHAANGCITDCIVLGDGQETLGKALEDFFQRSPEYRSPVVHIEPYRRSLHSTTKRHQVRQILAFLALLGAMLFWASGWVLGRLVGGSGMAAPLASTLRMSLLASFFLLWQLLGCVKAARASQEPELNSGRQLYSALWRAAFALDKRHLAYLLLSGLSFALYNLLLFSGLSVVFANQGGILTSVLVPLFSTLFYSLGHRVRLSRRQFWGLLCGLASGLILLGALSHGVGYLKGAIPGFAALASGWTGSVIYWQSSLFIGTALCWSLITLLSSKIQENYSLGKYSFYTYLFAALLTSWGWLWYRGSIQWLPLLALVLLGSVLGTSLYFQALRFLRPHYVASFLFLNPVFILLMSRIFLAEPWSLDLSVGSLLAVLAIALLNVSRRN